MKEKIYTIPINDAFDEECSCAICAIENKLDCEITESTLGASMMEPDFRIITNECGFCKTHYEALLNQSKALPLSLILQTHSDYQNKAVISAINEKQQTKKGLFKKENSEKLSAQNVINIIENLTNRCAICEKTQHLMEKYLENIIFLWKTEGDFKNKFNAKDGFCLPHFAKLIEHSTKNLNDKDFSEFYKTICNMEMKSLNNIYSDILEFTKLFDYKSNGAVSDNVKSAVKRTIHKYSGLIPKND